MATKPPAVVAELGRPETAQETADRKAAASAKRRSNQTVLNLVIATVASLAIVAFLVSVVVRPEPPAVEPIDFAGIAAETGETVVVPVLPPGWSANDARFGNSHEVPTWYVGFITPGTQFIALEQGLDANPSWLEATLDGATATTTARVDELTWTVYDQREAKDPGNFAYSMSTEVDGTTIVLHGTAVTEEFRVLAASIAAEVGDQ
jgi:hypothetical protein